MTAPDARRVVVERLADFDLQRIVTSFPMRDFARRLTQENKPVAVYMHTMKRLVDAESHHERVFLLLADWHPLVAFAAGQPFTIVWPTKSTPSSHTPDFLIVSVTHVPVVVDVKTPEDRASDYWQEREPKIRDALTALGVEYLVWTEMPRRYRLNLENFTAATVPVASVKNWSLLALQFAGKGTTAKQVAAQLDACGYPYLNSLTLIRHLLWRHVLKTDMHLVFTADSIVKGAER